QQVTATVNWDDGTTTDATLHTRFTSSNTSAIGVTNTPGTSGNGRVTFSAVGTSNITGSFTINGGDPNEPLPECPTVSAADILEDSTPGNTTPRIDSINPTFLNAGDNNKSVTIHGAGFGSSPVVNLPQGVTSSSQDNSDTTIVLPSVNVPANTEIGPNNITVTANSQTSAPSPFTIDGPDHMIVVSDTLGHCSGCTTAVSRI